MKWIICIVAILSACDINAQILNERKHITGGSSLWENFMKEMYQLPEFIEGVIVYKDGQQFKRKVNYNRMLETIQFIDDKGDTLVFDNDDVIRQVTAGDILYVYQPQCMQLLSGESGTRLFKHEKLRIADIRRKGALGIPNSTGSIESVNQIYSWMNSFNLDINELLLLAKTTSFFIEFDGKIVPASKKNFLNAHRKHGEAINNHIRENKISFTNEKDLISLTKFANAL